MSFRNSRNARERRSGGGSARRPRLDSSRAPKKPFGSRKSGKGARNSNDFRAAANSVFANPNATGIAVKGKNRVENADSSNFDDVGKDDFTAQGHRLQKVLAAAGFGSRRQCEELIAEGRVEVDGKIVSELGARVFPFSQKIRVDGEALPKTRPTYVALNKPKNTLCTNADPQGRRRVGDFIPAQFGRLFSIGRLDQNSEGLVLLTNDGALAERLTHPRFEVPKKYRVQVAGLVDFSLVRDLKRGVHIAEGIVQADDVVIRSRHKLSAILEITLKEGKNREIRRMLARIGHKVLALQRVQVGPIKLGTLAPGEYRLLTPQEVASLYRAAEVRARSENDDESAPRRAAPIEIAEIERRQAALEEERAAKPRAKDGSAPTFQGDPKRRFGNRFGEKLFDKGARRDARPEFREEFRSEERREDRRRAQREFDDETRTIGPRKFDRSENGERRDRFNDDASARRTPGAFGNRSKRGGFSDSKSNGGSKRSGGTRPGGKKRFGGK